ncbi:unnamed protein product [Aphanomyces euteiches]
MEVPLRDALDAFSASQGLHANSVRVVAALVACVGIAPLTHVISSPSLRHLWNFILGYICAWFCFDVATVHSSSVGSILTVVVFLHLFYANALREFYSQDIMWDAAHMVLTLKLVGLAISYSDGGLPSDEKTTTMLRNQVVDKPSLLALLGTTQRRWTFETCDIVFARLHLHVSNLLAGPVFEFHEYIEWIQVRRAAPLTSHLRNLFLALAIAAGHLASEMYFSPSIVDNPALFYPTQPTFIRLVFQCVAVMLFRCRFYLVWQLGETAGTLAGYGFNIVSNDWTGLRNNNLLLVEFPTNFRVAINNWNMRVSAWLNAYVYQRLGLYNGKPTTLSTLYTFVVSALWHGFLPGYYQFFIMGTLYIEVGKHIRRRIRPFFHYVEVRHAHPYAIFFECGDRTKAHSLAIFYDLGGMFVTWTMMQYIGVSFVLQNMTRCYTIWSGFYFLPHLVPMLLLVYFQATAPKKAKER